MVTRGDEPRVIESDINTFVSIIDYLEEFRITGDEDELDLLDGIHPITIY